MSVLSAQSIRMLMAKSGDGTAEHPYVMRRVVEPFEERQQDHATGTSFGLSACGYDIRVDQFLTLRPGIFCLASSLERFCMPRNVAGMVHDKSTWARRGLAVQNTVIEPGWEGYLTLELTNHHQRDTLTLIPGTPVAQVVFHWLDQYTEQPYDGKYQFQERGPQEAR